MEKTGVTNPKLIWDAIIIGAGPAGSTLAVALGRNGLSVLLLDQARFPRHKVCGGCLNGNAIAALHSLGLSKMLDDLGGHSIKSLLLASAGHTARIALETGMSVSREALDQALIAAAVDAGATFRSGVRATMKDATGAARIVHLREDSETVTATARVVILAHGLQAGTVARQSWIGAGVVMDMAPEGYSDHAISMAVGRGGYVGGVHVDRGRFDLASALDPRLVKVHGSLGLAAAALQRVAGLPEIPGLATAAWKGTPQLTRRPDAIAGHRWFAVGDAAGYVEPFTGEGMAWAITGAVALAPIVAAAVKNWRNDLIPRWNGTYAREVRRRQWSCRLLKLILHTPRLARGMIGTLSLVPGLANPVVKLLNRPHSCRSGVAS